MKPGPPLAAQLVARIGGLLGQKDAVAVAGELEGDAAPSQAAPNHESIVHEAERVGERTTAEAGRKGTSRTVQAWKKFGGALRRWEKGREGPTEGPVPTDGRGRQSGTSRQGVQVLTQKATANGQRGIVLHHAGQAQGAAQHPNADVREAVPVQVIDHNSQAGHAIHFGEERYRCGAVEMMQNERSVHKVDRRVGPAERKSVAHLHTDLIAEGRTEVGIQVGAGMPHRSWIGVDADQFNGASPAGAAADEVRKMVAPTTAHIDNAQARVAAEKRVQHGIGGGVAPEPLVDAP